MTNDPHRSAKKQYDEKIAFQALLREEAVINHYKSRGYQVLSCDDGETRKVFGMPPTSKAADIVVRVSTHRAIIAEVKGANLDAAIAQLQSTVNPVHKQFPHVACKVFTSTRVPHDDHAILPGGGPFACGYKALRVFHRDFPGEWLLMGLKPDGRTEPLRLGDEPASIVFGPLV